MSAGIIAGAAGLFAVTNMDDMVVLSLFFGRGAGHPGSARRIVTGQYLGFTAILAVAIGAAYGATFLPGSVIPYLGMAPLALGLRAAWLGWREHRRGDGGEQPGDGRNGPAALQVATVTFAGGGDNIGVYVPVFASAGLAGMSVYAVIFLILVGAWCAAGWFFATRPLVARALGRWGHILLPLVLITIGLLILARGGAFGL